MSAAIAAAAVVGAATIYSAKKAGDAADRQAGIAEQQTKTQEMIAQEQLELAREQWDLYQKEIFPQEQKALEMGVDMQELNLQTYENYFKPLQEQYAQSAMEGIEAQPERAAREARLAVDQAFDVEEKNQQLNLERRGVRPGSGAYQSGIADTSLNRAAAKGYAVNRAVEAEHDRVEDANFNRMGVALGRAPTVSGGSAGINAASGMYGMSAAGRTAGNAAGNSTALAGMYGDATSSIVSGGVQLGKGAYDFFNQYQPFSSPAGGGVDLGFNPSAPSNPVTLAHQPSAGGGVDIGFNPTVAGGGGDLNLAYNQGGPVKAPQMYRHSYATGGEVQGPPGADRVPAHLVGPDGQVHPARLTEGEYVVTAKDVNGVGGPDELEAIIERAQARKMQKRKPQAALTRRGG